MIKAKNPDYILTGSVVILTIFGILMLASVSASFSINKFGSPYYFLNHQIIYGLIPGIILGFAVYKISLKTIKKWIPAVFLANLILMLLVFLPKVGVTSGGAARWIVLGPITFQPSEFLKVSFLLYLAAWLAKDEIKNLGMPFRNRLREKATLLGLKEEWSARFIPFLVTIGILGLCLISQPDISTLGIIIIIATILYFAAGTPLLHTVLMISAMLSGLFFLVNMAPYRLNRFLVFLKPETDPMGIGYQIKQAQIAVGSGGIAGLGLGESLQKFGFLPQPMSDSIFAIFAEETGFLGSITLAALFLIFFWRGTEIARKTRDKFSQFAALGISSWITIQAFINIASMVGVLPLSGIPLPLISYGGSALLAELTAVGILLNISRQAN